MELLETNFAIPILPAVPTRRVSAHRAHRYPLAAAHQNLPVRLPRGVAKTAQACARCFEYSGSAVRARFVNGQPVTRHDQQFPWAEHPEHGCRLRVDPFELVQRVKVPIAPAQPLEPSYIERPHPVGRPKQRPRETQRGNPRVH